MADPPPESSHSTPGTPVSDSTRLHSSMEDPDSEGHRKRPRLDSGSRVRESLSIDAAFTPAAPASAMDLSPDSRPSKMTINVKSPTCDMNSESIEPASLQPDSPLPHSITDPDANPDNVISISSSPAHSPEIEVAELEDMDQDPNTSSWRPLDEALRDQTQPEVIEVDDTLSPLDSFPSVRENATAFENLQYMIAVIERCDPRDALALTALKVWLADCAKNLDRLTAPAITEDLEFWNRLPFLLEILLRRQQELLIDDGSEVLKGLEDFFIDYVKIAVHMIRLDIMFMRRLGEEPDTQLPDSPARRWITPLAWLLGSQNIPLYRAIETQYKTNTVDLVRRIRARSFIPPIDAPSVVAEYTSLLLKTMLKAPSLLNALKTVLIFATSVADCTPDKTQNEQDSNTEFSTDLSADSSFLMVIYDTVRQIDVQYQEWVTKKSALVSSENTEHMLLQIPRVYMLLCKSDPVFIDRIAQDLGIELPEGASIANKTDIISWGWKLGVLKKHIMEGRMELRVCGVETMQSHLVKIWAERISNNATAVKSPEIQYLVRYIRSNKFVDYLVGVESHPQLICRSSNIVGFLVVASSYTNLETDVIWKAVTESQDSRIVSEVLAMLTRTLYMHSTASPALLYICEKVLRHPLERFDANVLEFCDILLGRMYHQPGETGYYDNSGLDRVNAVALWLCVRLIRESTAADNLSDEQRTKLQDLGSRQLASCIRAGVSGTDRAEIYERCILDIAEMNAFTAGSIQVLNALVPIQDAQEIYKLDEQYDLTRLVITDLLHTVNGDQVDLSDAFSHHGLVSRVMLLFRLVDMAPETITPELGKAFWNDILLSSKLGVDGHKSVWGMMSTALTHCTKANPFLDRCIHEYLPGLVPKDYSPELLAFTKMSITYQLRFYPPPAAVDNEIVTIPGMDRIWNFILTSPPGTIENEATDYAIKTYLDHPIIRNSPPSAVEATHISIAGRCIEQLKNSAAALRTSHATNGDSAMEIENIDGAIGPEELRFRRSLQFLYRLLHGLRSRRQYVSPRGSPPSLPERPVKGDPVELSWQSFNGNAHSGVKVLQIGSLSTATELVELLCQLTGFSKFSAICGGQRLNLLEDPGALVGEIKKLQGGLLILRKAPDAQEVARDNGQHSLTSVDFEVMKHFDEIYEFLVLKEDVAREVFDFLAVFPPPDRIVDLVRSEQIDEKTLFPFVTPFIAFYSFYVLLICLRDESTEAIPNRDFASHSIERVVAFLMADEFAGSLIHDSVKFWLATKALESLQAAFNVYGSPSDDATLVQDPAKLVKRLLSFIEMAQSAPSLPFSVLNQNLIRLPFALLIDGSTRDSKFWNAVKQETHFGQLIQSLLLNESRSSVRIDVAERIKMTCGPLKSQKQVQKANEQSQSPTPAESTDRIDMLATVWDAFLKTIPKAPEFASQSAEFFTTALWVFRVVAERSPRDIIFSQYLRDWSLVMLQHRTQEFVGRETIDHLMHGFALLLELCLDLAEKANVDLGDCDLAEHILGIYLFPDLSPDIENLTAPQLPVLHSPTRQKLYSIVGLLCKRNDVNLAQVIDMLEPVVPRDVSYGPNSSWDRSKIIRAPPGYAGLKNLSNTCYLNSLMTQLFMNIEFRDFILKLDLVDPHSSQRLLKETQKLFAMMQDTFTKHTDPADFVEQIKTYDNEAIDVTIQMDVDEFYNLLFDRWEAQIVDPQEKKKFRSFYGGQLVQQIKSQECPHISEREEPFSAIQCDIKGKASLEESLQAYVEGEIMQGENKYSCTGCNRHVDAVKRASLKHVPDDLIFHLKRFDFDMVSLTRSKINDEFQFPDRIDMTPYKVEHLSDPEAHIEPDIFELVGVLIHTGTAESGHYYSYTRERPSSGTSTSWVEFNDSDVSSFDPATIADQCFGGPSGTMGGQMHKVWNAYMLFYQRVSTMEASKEIYKPLNPGYPVRAWVPDDLTSLIAGNNEITIRSYCLLDPLYASFVQGLLQHVQSFAVNFERKRDLELKAITVALDTYEQLIARSKDHSCLDAISTEISDLISRNVHAALEALQWFHEKETSMRNLVLKMPNTEVRKQGIMFLIDAMGIVENYLRDPSVDEQEGIDMQVRFDGLVEDIIRKLEDLWPALQTVSRVWDDYFDILLKMIAVSPGTVDFLLENGFFVRCLEIIWLDQEDRKRLRSKYSNYIRLIDKGRRFSYLKMMALCAVFFKKIDFALPPVRDDETRHVLGNVMYSLSVTENKFIKPIDEDGSLSVLQKILQHDHFGNTKASYTIIAALLQSEPQAGLLDNIIKALQVGLRLSPADLSIPFLEATCMFCKWCPGKADAADIIRFVAKGVESIDGRASVDHLEFFTRICTTSNERLRLGEDWFSAIVQDEIPSWAPTLLIDTDRSVRQGTMDILKTLLFSNENIGLTTESQARYYQIGRNLMISCVQRVEKSFIHSQVQQVESRIVDSIIEVIKHCQDTYFDDEDEEDRRTLDSANAILAPIEDITVEVQDDLVSESDLPSADEWEATSALASDSEMGVAGSP
ncbi:uncharacterized protein N7443_003088 [Penicillium atrosanguineum]|uniref:uncharacterized protein n=1 Tax=Penicillium atrosanguineum TaxID=1132637 RepID=UPI00239F68AD|nr:uncharacterized protein N7443_003088 [Penicillium atrosanguineum]KAJ5310627.1 hypothetical protein N7443_003088 [Penicillium atrosanguineum]